ncbi:ATP-binding cassette domain-containing protein [Agaribacter marinus]|uniref:ABC transporter domain-containing protein n=1 Tax=Agaribacter marinus TaxID=1431249 RepID=A0AA37T110_9ALTE|nr:ATP-binding cassette domain-containing protein [Agaribacter marinus]GLR71681.1 hypothetical protein GCM10007852_25890 [Agaribacter marinus]
MYEIHGLSINRGTKVLIKNVDVDFRANKITAIIGANGAGKSTLFKALLGEFIPDAGQIHFDNKNIQAWSLSDLSKKRAYIAQSFRPTIALPVFEYLALAREQYHESEQRTQRLVFEIASKMGIHLKLLACITHLSGGEFQMLEFARAWLQLCGSTNGNGSMKGKCLMLDEPSSALDICQSQRLYTHVKHFQQAGGTVLIIDHDINAVSQLADDLVFIKDGALQTCGPTPSVFTAENLNDCFNTSGQIQGQQANKSHSNMRKLTGVYVLNGNASQTPMQTENDVHSGIPNTLNFDT